MNAAGNSGPELRRIHSLLCVPKTCPFRKVIRPGFASPEATDPRQEAQAGIVRVNSVTLPKRQNRISGPLIFLHFSGSI